MESYDEIYYSHVWRLTKVAWLEIAEVLFVPQLKDPLTLKMLLEGLYPCHFTSIDCTLLSYDFTVCSQCVNFSLVGVETFICAS